MSREQARAEGDETSQWKRAAWSEARKLVGELGPREGFGQGRDIIRTTFENVFRGVRMKTYARAEKREGFRDLKYRLCHVSLTLLRLRSASFRAR